MMMKAFRSVMMRFLWRTPTSLVAPDQLSTMILMHSYKKWRRYAAAIPCFRHMNLTLLVGETHDGSSAANEITMDEATADVEATSIDEAAEVCSHCIPRSVHVNDIASRRCTKPATLAARRQTLMML